MYSIVAHNEKLTLDVRGPPTGASIALAGNIAPGVVIPYFSPNPNSLLHSLGFT